MAEPHTDATRIRRIAQEQRFQIGPLEKAIRLASFLARLAEHPSVGRTMALPELDRIKSLNYREGKTAMEEQAWGGPRIRRSGPSLASVPSRPPT